MNPNGPYPGRQLFIGTTMSGNPAAAYLVTGRSPSSRGRKAIITDNGIMIGPIDNQQYDPLRHYIAIKYDNTSGNLVVSNGIQTESIFETYRLLFNVGSAPSKEFMEMLLNGAQAEPDNFHTPRIAGVITNGNDKKPINYIGIIRHDMLAKAFQVETNPGTLLGISTYKGSLENPEPFDLANGLVEIDFNGKTPIELAEHLFEISKAVYDGEDIRVCALGAIRSADRHTWQVAVRNR